MAALHTMRRYIESEGGGGGGGGEAQRAFPWPTSKINAE